MMSRSFMTSKAAGRSSSQADLKSAAKETFVVLPENIPVKGALIAGLTVT
jgi:hypothetical protein